MSFYIFRLFVHSSLTSFSFLCESPSFFLFLLISVFPFFSFYSYLFFVMLHLVLDITSSVSRGKNWSFALCASLSLSLCLLEHTWSLFISFSFVFFFRSNICFLSHCFYKLRILLLIWDFSIYAFLSLLPLSLSFSHYIPVTLLLAMRT